MIREFEERDQNQVIVLIDSAYREYGDRLCLEDHDKDLLAVHKTYFAAGGVFFVLDLGEVKGTCAVLPRSEEVCEFFRLYLHPELRGSGWAQKLARHRTGWCKSKNFKEVIVWSDERFGRAHSFFKSQGFEFTGKIREMHDGHLPYKEKNFRLCL